MERHIAVTALIALALLTGCKRSADPQPAQASASAEPQLSAEAYGPIHFGEALAQVDAKLGPPTGTGTDEACRYVEFPSLPGARFMVESGVITRADAGDGVTNTLGAKVGDSADELLRRHPGAQRQPHKYEPGGEYLIYAGAKPGSAIVLETRDGKVTKIRAGLAPAVHYVESCG